MKAWTICTRVPPPTGLKRTSSRESSMRAVKSSVRQVWATT